MKLKRIRGAVAGLFRPGAATESRLPGTSPEAGIHPVDSEEALGLCPQDLEELKRLAKNSRRPQPGRYFSIIPDHELNVPFGPVRECLDTPVHSTSFEKITREFDLRECISRDSMRIPALEDREHYHPGREYDYWLSGLRDYFRVAQELERTGSPLSSGQSIFELGAASGRVLRHFIAQDDNDYKIFASDMNSNHVEWILRYFPPCVRAFETSVFPSLPLEDNSIDLAMAFSVFTHIDEFEMAWIMEIRRILKPGGVAFLTFQSDRTWETLNEDHFLYQHLKSNEYKLGGCRIDPGLFNRPMPREKVVYRFMDNNVYNTVVFTSSDYVRSRWGRCFNRLDLLPCAHEFQDVALLRK